MATTSTPDRCEQTFPPLPLSVTCDHPKASHRDGGCIECACPRNADGDATNR